MILPRRSVPVKIEALLSPCSNLATPTRLSLMARGGILARSRCLRSLLTTASVKKDGSPICFKFNLPEKCPSGRPA
eukprot:4772263-Amphidinium_carterae.1